MIKRTLISYVLVLTVLLMAGCAEAPAATATDAPTTVASETTTTTTAPETTTANAPIELKVIAPYGTPTLTMVKLFVDQPMIADDVTVEYEAIQATDVLTSQLINQQADMAIVPTNLAAALFQKGIDYRLAGSSVWGVLYIVSNQDITSIADLKGKKIALIGRNLTPDAMFRYILTENGIDPENDLSLEYFSGSSELAPNFISGKYDVAMMPQPLLSMALAKRKDAKVVLDLQAEWQKLTGLDSYPQASLIVKQDLIDRHPEIVEAFIRAYDVAVDWVNDNPTEAGQYYESLGIGLKAPIIAKAIPQSNMDFVDIDEAKSAVDTYLDVLYQFNPKLTGGQAVDEELYLD